MAKDDGSLREKDSVAMQSLFENGLATGRDRTVLISQTQTPGQNGS